jgi:hypothetical protein
MGKLIRLSAFLLVIVLMAVSAEYAQAVAVQINVDFNGNNGATYSGAAVLGTSGNTWNGINGDSGTNIPLVSASNNATAVTLTYNDTDGAFNGNSRSDMEFHSTAYQSLMTDYLTVDPADSGGADTLTVTLNGLTPNGVYNLYDYAAANAPGRETIFTVNGISQNVTNTSATTFVAGQNYTEFTAATADATGQLVISYAQGNDDEGDFDGFQIIPAAAPEPSTLVLTAVGAIALLAVGRRRIVG